MGVDAIVNLFKFRKRRGRTLLSGSQLRAILMTITIISCSAIYATKFDETEIRFLGTVGATWAGLRYFLRD